MITNFREELDFRLAPDCHIAITIRSKNKVTQEEMDFLIEMLKIQREAFPLKGLVEPFLPFVEGIK